MGVSNETFCQGRDVYWRYDWEDVAFRWDHATGKTFQKFRGQEEFEAHPDSKLKDDSQIDVTSVEITKHEYERF